MKKRGHVYTSETAFYQSDMVKEKIRDAKRKPMYFTPAGATKMDRD